VTVGKSWGLYQDAKSNGEQDFEEINGVTYAGDKALDVAQPAVPWQHVSEEANDALIESNAENSSDEDDTATHAMAELYEQTVSMWEILTAGQDTFSEQVTDVSDVDGESDEVVVTF